MGAHGSRQATNPAAWHEAGHVIAGILLGFVPRMVTIRPTKAPEMCEAFGLTVFRGRPSGTSSHRTLDRWGAVLVAGGLEEMAVSGQAKDDTDQDELARTFEVRCQVRRRLRAFAASATGRRLRSADARRDAFMVRVGFEGRFEVWRRRCVAEARRLFRSPRARRAVASLAQALVERGTLRGGKIVAAAGLTN